MLLPIPTTSTGVKMRLTGWAIALAAAGLTPAAVHGQTAAPTSATTSAATPAVTPAAGTAQDATKPDAAQPAIVPGSVGHAIPTPGIGEPDGRKGIQLQVTPIGREAQAFHDNWLLLLCAIISVLVLGLLLYAMVRYRRGANPVPSRNSHNTMIEVIWTLVPVLVLVAIAIPSIKLLSHQYSPPPADVTVKVTGHQWYWSYEYPDNGVTFDSYMLKEKDDPTRQANQRFRTDADGPPLLAADERMVIPVGKVVKFIITADDVIHSFAVPGLLGEAGRQPRPAPRDLGQGRPAGRLFRAMFGTVRRAPRLHADRRRGGPAGAVRAVDRVQGRAHEGRRAAGPGAPRPRRPAPPRLPPPPSRAAAEPATRPAPTATNQAATAQN